MFLVCCRFLFLKQKKKNFFIWAVIFEVSCGFYFSLCASGIEEVITKHEFIKETYHEAKYDIEPHFVKFMFLRHLYGLITTGLICYRITTKFIIKMLRKDGWKKPLYTFASENWLVLNNKHPATEMLFGDDIYALSVAMLHKKNAKHLRYFDQDEMANQAEEHMASHQTE